MYPTWDTKYTPVSHIGGILDTGVHDCTMYTLCTVGPTVVNGRSLTMTDLITIPPITDTTIDTMADSMTDPRDCDVREFRTLALFL